MLTKLINRGIGVQSPIQEETIKAMAVEVSNLKNLLLVIEGE